MENLVDFVGTSSGPGDDWDSEHDGHWGANTAEVLDGFRDWASEFQADIGIIHLGTNDMSAFEVNESVDMFEEIIGLFRQNNPSVGIIVAQIPSWSDRRDEKVAAFNEEILRLQALSTDVSPIQIVDPSEGYDRETDNYDNVHPNESGAKKYAEDYYPAVVDMINHHRGGTAPSMDVSSESDRSK